MHSKFINKIIWILLLVLFFVSTKDSFSKENSSNKGFIIEDDKTGGKRFFYIKGDKKKEVKNEGNESFTNPTLVKVSEDNKFIIFIDSVENNKFDSYLCLYNIEKNKTKIIDIRNANVKNIRDIEWFDTHSFVIRITTSKSMRFVIGEHGPFKSGNYIVKFNDEHEIDKVEKLEW